MGCTSSKSQVIVTNVSRIEERPSALHGKETDINNNDEKASISMKTHDESQVQNDIELSQTKDDQLEGDSRENQDPTFVVAEKEDDIGLNLSSQPSPHHNSKDGSQPLQKTKNQIEKTGKYRLYSSVDEFRDVDQHALQVGFLYY